MPLGDIKISSNFSLSSQRPLDDRIIVANEAERFAFTLDRRHDLMRVDDLDTTTYWQLVLGTVDQDLMNNANWVQQLPGVVAKTFGLVYGYNDTVIEEDPGDGNFAVLGTTILLISKTMFVEIDNTPQLEDIVKDVEILLYQATAPDIYKSFKVTATITDSGTYISIPVSLNSNNIVFDTSEQYSIVIQFSGVTPVIIDTGVDLSTDIVATIAAGGIEVGDSFDTSKTIRDLWNALIAPYVAPVLSDITISPGATVEVGTTITIVSATLTWVIDSETNPPINAVITGPGFGAIALTTSGQVVAATASTTVQKTTDTTQSWVFSATDKDSVVIPSKTRFVYWQFMWTFGASSTSIVDDTTAQTVIESLQVQELKSGKANIVTATEDNNNPANYTYIVYAAKFGDLTSVLQDGALDVLDGFFEPEDFNYINSQGHSELYKVYKSRATGAYSADVVLTIT